MKWAINLLSARPAVIEDVVKFDRRHRNDVRFRIMCAPRIAVVPGRSKASGRKYPIRSDLLPFDVDCVLYGGYSEVIKSKQWLVASHIRDVYAIAGNQDAIIFIVSESLQAKRIHWYDYAVVGIGCKLRWSEEVSLFHERG